MKKIKFLFFLAFFATLFVGCQENDPSFAASEDPTKPEKVKRCPARSTGIGGIGEAAGLGTATGLTASDI